MTSFSLLAYVFQTNIKYIFKYLILTLTFPLQNALVVYTLYSGILCLRKSDTWKLQILRNKNTFKFFQA